MKKSLLFITLFVIIGTKCNKFNAIDKDQKRQHFLEKFDTKSNVVVHFNKPIDTVIDQINIMHFPNIFEKRITLTRAQQSFTKSMQKPLQEYLNNVGVQYESFWINNQMYIPNLNKNLIQNILRLPNVAKIELEPEPFKLEFEGTRSTENTSKYLNASEITWGVKKIGANRLWNNYTGRGILVAVIDSGVRYSHQSLYSNWRQNYGWFDPYNKTSLPCDEEGHGTHVTGTIAGIGGIGVAPGASWIACKGCYKKECYLRRLLACAQWVQCPTKPNGTFQNCHVAPHIVSNSWGNPDKGKTSYDEVFRSWRAAGIIPVFSAGNDGPECKTLTFPGNDARVIGVTAIRENEKIYEYASRGPTLDGRIHPVIAAPGVKIISATNKNDTGFASLSGTSMACPHVSGVIALMMEKNRSLIYDRDGFNKIYKAITSTAVTETLNTSSANTCGGIEPNRFPNHVFGYGRIDAYKAVGAI